MTTGAAAYWKREARSLARDLRAVLVRLRRADPDTPEGAAMVRRLVRLKAARSSALVRAAHVAALLSSAR